MKITKEQLKQLIKEELEEILGKQDPADPGGEEKSPEELACEKKGFPYAFNSDTGKCEMIN